MLKPLLDDHAGSVDEIGHVPRRGGLKDELTGAVVHKMRRAGSKPSGPGRPIAGEDPIVEADEELAIPFEGGVISAAQDKAHRIAVPTDERSVLFPRLSWTVADEDVVNLLDCDRDAFHRRRRRDGLGLKVATESTGPGPGTRTPVVQLGFPTVQFGSQVNYCPRVVRQQHAPIIQLIR